MGHWLFLSTHPPVLNAHGMGLIAAIIDGHSDLVVCGLVGGVISSGSKGVSTVCGSGGIPLVGVRGSS